MHQVPEKMWERLIVLQPEIKEYFPDKEEKEEPDEPEFNKLESLNEEKLKTNEDPGTKTKRTTAKHPTKDNERATVGENKKLQGRQKAVQSGRARIKTGKNQTRSIKKNNS